MPPPLMLRSRLAAPLLSMTLLLALTTAAGGGQRPAKITTADAKSLKCTFTLVAIGTWSEDTPRADIKDAKVSVEFSDIDTQEGIANAKGGSGAPHVVVRLSGGILHFLQVSNSGPLYVTSVFDQATPGGKLKAVHTRHEYTLVSLPGFTSRPEQYYGSCEVLAK